MSGYIKITVDKQDYITANSFISKVTPVETMCIMWFLVYCTDKTALFRFIAFLQIDLYIFCIMVEPYCSGLIYFAIYLIKQMS